jgi:hypothetical protein
MAKPGMSKEERGKMQKTLDDMGRAAQKMGSRIARAAQETPQYIGLRRNERAIKSEIDDELLAIGKRVRALHRRAKNSPFERYGDIMDRLAAIDRLDREYRETRVKLNQLREEMRGKGSASRR